MTSKIETKDIFALHHKKSPLLVANVWDAHTAKLAQDAGFKLLATSSHAIANSLGYEDGEQIPIEDLFFVIQRIMNVAKIPVSVDFEGGYSNDPKQVARYAEKLVKMGVSGINLEDGKVKNGQRKLQNMEVLAEKIREIKKLSPNLFINARTDTYTTKVDDALEVSIKRANYYRKAGADGIFVPLMEKTKDIKKFVESVKLPLNLFASAKLPAYQNLKELGVKRISHGAKQFEGLMKISEKNFKTFKKSKDYTIMIS